MVRIKHSKIRQILDPMLDRISLLPEEIILRILSFLTMREAVGTSLVCKRFRNMWMRIPSLTFSAKSLYGRELSQEEQLLKMNEFIERVDGILSQLLNHSLSMFCVHYELTEAVFCDIDRWVSFALEHNVESLHLHLSKGGIIWYWLFPPHAVSKRRLPNLRSLHLGGCKIVSSLGSFKNLRLVSLTFVVVADDTFEDLLSNCVLLEELYICSAKGLTSIRIPESLVRLRFLKIYLCENLEKVEVNAVNLVSFLYHGAKIDFLFNNISKLQLLRVGWLDDVSCQLMSKNSLLHTLILDFHLFFENFDMDYKLLPTLTSLKVLILSVASLKSGFVEFVNLLRATPSLNKFGLHLKYSDYTSQGLSEKVTEKFHHKHLKEIELTGFSGKEAHMELAFFLIESAVALEKITLGFHVSKWQREKLETSQLDDVKLCGDRISSKLPPGAKLEIVRCRL